MMANVTINKKLNLVIPIEEDGNIKAWIHSSPISREVFESNYLLIVKTLSNLYGNGVGPVMSVRVAKLGLKDTAKEMNDQQDISINLINEIHRLTMILMPNPMGKWESLPYDVVANRKLIDEDTLAEVENALVYFIVASAIHLKNELPTVYQGLFQIWNAQTTSSNVTDYMSSLPMLTPTENTGERVTVNKLEPKASFIPS
jgi:hypothetical protein